MAYTPTNWKDRDVENPRTYTARQNEDGSITFFDAPGTINEAGTPVNAVNMNKIEEQLYKNDLERKITNCITEIPQDIKLELNDGVLTLKAGSKVYVPNGFEADGVTPKFDVVVISADTSRNTVLFDGKMMLFYYLDGNLSGRNLSTTVETGSGTTLPSNDNYTFYNTSDNKIYVKRNNQIESYTSSFPIGVATVSGGVITSIDQVFNGFGYIGSTVFALPSVKGLIPNGRNADGSLKNVEFTVDKVLTYTNPNKYIKKYIVTFDLLKRLRIYENVYYGYDEYKNIHIDTYSNKEVTNIPVASILTDSNGVITSFSPKIAFHAVDYNDSSWISAQAMPSNKYIDLTLGASGSTYTAPANGYFQLSGVGTNGSNSCVVYIYSSDNGEDVFNSPFVVKEAAWATVAVAVTYPILKGKTVKIGYDRVTFSYSGYSNLGLKFIYAEGEE